MAAKAKGARKPRKPTVEAQAVTEAVEATVEPVRLTAQAREEVAADVLDLTLMLLQKRLRDEPGEIRASGIAEITKCLSMYWRWKDRLDKGAQDESAWRDYVKDMPTYADHDPDDPLLQGHRDEHHEYAPVVSAEEIAALSASFDND